MIKLPPELQHVPDPILELQVKTLSVLKKDESEWVSILQHHPSLFFWPCVSVISDSSLFISCSCLFLLSRVFLFLLFSSTRRISVNTSTFTVICPHVSILISWPLVIFLPFSLLPCFSLVSSQQSLLCYKTVPSGCFVSVSFTLISSTQKSPAVFTGAEKTVLDLFPEGFHSFLVHVCVCKVCSCWPCVKQTNTHGSDPQATGVGGVHPSALLHA